MVRVKDRPSGAAPSAVWSSQLGDGPGGWVGWGPLQVRPCKLGRACSCALSCAHGKTGVGRPAQPARGMPRAHGAHAPSQPTLPAMDSFLRTAGRSKEKSKAKADPSDIPGVCHPRMAWIYRVDQGRHLPTAAQNAFRQIAEDCRRRGGSGGGGVRGMDAAAKPPGTGLRRPPPPDPPRHPSVAQLLTLPLRVQGAALPEPLTLSRLQPPQCGDAPAMPAAIPLPPADHRRPAPPRTPDRS